VVASLRPVGLALAVGLRPQNPKSAVGGLDRWGDRSGRLPWPGCTFWLPHPSLVRGQFKVTNRDFVALYDESEIQNRQAFSQVFWVEIQYLSFVWFLVR